MKVVLDEFIISNRDSIVAQARARVAARTSLKPTLVHEMSGIPVFLDQLGDALRLAKSTDDLDHKQISDSAAQHGRDLLRKGLTIDQVVHDYGDVCQVVSELAIEQKMTISGKEFKTLNLCLDDAIAGAVTAFARRREQTIRQEAQDQGTERLGTLAHELRNMLNTATLAFETIRSGRVAVGGNTGMVLARGLVGLRNLIDRSLADVRLDAGIGRFELISVAEFLEEAQIGASLQAQQRGIRLVVSDVERAVTIEGDREILLAAISNLLQNAFKFTHPNTTVSLTTEVTADRVRFNIEDECGGLPPGKTEELFLPFQQRGSDRSGVGLGLSICVKAAKANGGEVRVRDIPGKGCVFTLDMPRKPPPPLSIVGSGNSVSPPPAVGGARG
jgi:signal transduction histidine kinase